MPRLERSGGGFRQAKRERDWWRGGREGILLVKFAIERDGALLGLDGGDKKATLNKAVRSNKLGIFLTRLPQ